MHKIHKELQWRLCKMLRLRLTHPDRMRKAPLSMTLACIAYIAFLFSSIAHAEADWGAFDTVAGFPMTVTIDGGIVPGLTRWNGKKMTLYGECPGGSVEEREYVTDGIVEFVISDEWTHTAGVCTFTLIDYVGKQIAWGEAEIFADVVQSRRLEQVDPDDEWIVDREIELKAGFFDRYGNRAAETLTLMSSDADIESGARDMDGYEHFLVIPTAGGEISLTLVDTLTGESKRYRFSVHDPSANAVATATSTKSSSTSDLLRNLILASLLDEIGGGSDGVGNENGIGYGLIHSFDVEVGDNESTLRVNEQYDLTVIALDRRDRRVENFVDRVIIDTTDVDAVLPSGSVRFKATDRGRKILPLAIMFQTPGEQTITIRNEADPEEIFGSTKVWVVGQSGQVSRREIIITDYPEVSAGRAVTIDGTAPAYTNLRLFSLQGEEETLLAETSSDVDGAFTFTITLNADRTEHTLRIRDPEGRVKDSDPITITIDAVTPTLRNVTVTPASVLPGSSFTVSMQAEAGEAVWASLEGSPELSLAEGQVNDEGMGIYEGTLTAPMEPGTFTVRVRIKDRAGNELTEDAQVTVITPAESTVPVVSGLVARTENQDVLLSWQALADIARYRIYFGPNASNLETSVETEGPRTSVRLTGLTGGQSYAFAVTAISLRGEESMARSNIVSVQTRGSLFDLQAVGMVNGAQLTWQSPPGADVVSYRIKYGVQTGAYTEQRLFTVPVGSTQHRLVDLINGVPYFLLLSAVQRDGTILADTMEIKVMPGRNGMPGMHLSLQ